MPSTARARRHEFRGPAIRARRIPGAGGPDCAGSRPPHRRARRMRMLRLLIGLLLVLPLGGLAQEQPAFLVTRVGSYHDDGVLAQRVGADGAAELTRYVDAIVRSIGDHVVARPRARGLSVALVVAIRPGRQSRAWLVTAGDPLPDGLEAEFIARALAVPPPALSAGPVAFYLVCELWGGGRPVISDSDPYPVPAEWLEALRRSGGGRLPDTPLERLWPAVEIPSAGRQ